MKKKWILLLLITISFTSLTAQDALYPNTFPLGDVRITAGPFKHACDLNVKVLLQYDTDRLLAPFLREAGLPKKAETYGNWEKDGLDGHIGGHYLTALAIHYAATGNLECKKRMVIWFLNLHVYSMLMVTALFAVFQTVRSLQKK